MKVKLMFIPLLITGSLLAQTPSDTSIVKNEPEKKKNWYETISLRGYTQVRYNRLLETNEKLKCEQCDKSWGENGGFFLRRIRLVFSGNVHDRVYIYIQPDLASSASSTGLHFAQIRDAYFDLSLDKKKEFRFRFGQSKVPFGFENLQSSQNRLSLDRNDGLNSALSNERDLGVVFYWAPSKIRERFSMLVNSGLKGSGDYGVFALGAYNGQTANKPEPADNDPHVVARLSYPFELPNGQIFEPGIQGYTGTYVLPSDLISPGVKINADKKFLDQRYAASFIVYPQPFGFQAEYNMGKGPEYNPATDSIETRDLEGGYVLISTLLKIKKHIVIPFAKGQYYLGGKKHELDARSYGVNDMEFGIEWQPIKNFELVAMYTMSTRKFEDHKLPSNIQTGNLLRLQVQFNY